MRTPYRHDTLAFLYEVYYLLDNHQLRIIDKINNMLYLITYRHLVFDHQQGVEQTGVTLAVSTSR